MPESAGNRTVLIPGLDASYCHFSDTNEKKWVQDINYPMGVKQRRTRDRNVYNPDQTALRIPVA